MIFETPAEVADELVDLFHHNVASDEAHASDVALAGTLVPPVASFTVETRAGKRFCVQVRELWG